MLLLWSQRTYTLGQLEEPNEFTHADLSIYASVQYSRPLDLTSIYKQRKVLPPSPLPLFNY